MKVLHVLRSNIFSGAENVVCQIIKMSYGDGVEMVYCSEDGEIRQSLIDRDVDFAPVKKMCKSELRRIIDSFHPDIIHAHDRMASLCAAKAANGIPIIVHMHVNNNKGFKLLLKNFLWFLCSKKFKHIFWVSKSSYEGFQFHKLLKKKSSVLYNVIDRLSLFERCESDPNEYSYDIVYCGRLTYQKNPQLLMDVCKKIAESSNHFKIAIIGDGEFSEYVKASITSYHLEGSVKYLGYVQNPLKIIKDSKALVLTSRFEGTPMVAIEAQLLGVPIVSTPVDGMRDLILSGQNGYLENNPSSLANRLIEICSDAGLRDKLGKCSKDMSRKFSDVRGYKEHLYSIYNMLV